MTTYTVATRNYPTKKSFMEAVKNGINSDGVTTLRDIHDRIDFTFTVTNTNRAWFAECVVRKGRKIICR